MAPYRTWETAAVTIQDGVGAASAGDEVLVTNGVYATGGRIDTYSLVNRVAVGEAVTVRSVNGPNCTFIVGQGVGTGGTNNGFGAVRCASLGRNAVLSGFTLTNGHTIAIDNLSSEKHGGGAYCTGGAVLTNCILTGNSSSYDGGGVYYGGGALYVTLNNCILTGNSAGRGGGSYGCVLNYCALSGNFANHGGGAFWGTLNNCTVTGNSGGLGGGVNFATVYNCTLVGNSARDGGGAWWSTLYNCTLTGNSASQGGGTYRGLLNNCIIYYNTAETGPNYYSDDAYPCTFAYSCTTPLPPGEGNIDSDPLLASATHLSAQSPCIGSGSAAYLSGFSRVDIDGEPWLSPPAIGADQFVAGAATGELSISITAVYTNPGVDVTISFEAQIDGLLTASVWDFGDGLVISNHVFNISHAWTTPGLYAVRLTGYNDSYPGGISATALVQVVAQQVFYAPPPFSAAELLEIRQLVSTALASHHAPPPLCSVE